MSLFAREQQLWPLRSIILRLKQTVQARNFSSKRKPTGKAKQAPADIEIKHLTRCDEVEMINFLLKFFYSEEPLNVGLAPVGRLLMDEKYLIGVLSNDMSFKALLKIDDNKSKMVGALLACPKFPKEAQRRYKDYCKYGDTKLGLKQKLMAQLEQQGNVFKSFNVREAVHVEAVATDTSVRGRAIGLRLVKEVFKHAKKRNYKVVTVDCTSQYSAQFCDRLGMETIATVHYKDFLDDKGQQIFTPPPPHEFVKAYAKRV